MRTETVLVSFTGDLTEEEVHGELRALSGPNGTGRYREGRWFTKDDELLRFGGRTYVLTNRWGPRTELAMRNIAAAFQQHRMTIEATDSGS